VSTIRILSAPEQDGNISDDAPYEPYPLKRGIYAYAKLKAEAIVNELKDVPGISVSIIRPGLVYGKEKPLLPMLMKKIERNTYLSLESARRILPCVHIDNLIDALMLAGRKGAKWGVYNLVDDEKITAKDLMKIYRKATGSQIRCVFIPHHILKGVFALLDAMIFSLLERKPGLYYNLLAKGQKRIYANQKIKSELGWQQRTTLLEGLQDMTEKGVHTE
jgi:nucleoside-diphosphate-sugar epimerase